MKLKNPTLSIIKDDPFKEDVLQRKKCADVLTALLLTIEEPFVLSVSSPWGTGKTTFIDMWRQHLENNFFSLCTF